MTKRSKLILTDCYCKYCIRLRKEREILQIAFESMKDNKKLLDILAEDD